MPNNLSGGYDKYPIIHDCKLPGDVRDEICDDCPGNDAGRIFNPEYHPKFKAWLEQQNLELKPYIVWFSW
jgi:hypothetical protein